MRRVSFSEVITGKISELFCAVLCTEIVPGYIHTHISSSYRGTMDSWFRLRLFVCVFFS